MKGKKIFCLLFVCVQLFLLCSCKNAPMEAQGTLPPHQPSTGAPETSAPTESKPFDEEAIHADMQAFGGMSALGVTSEYHMEDPRSLPYDGGEMHIPLLLSADGTVREKGIGLLFFLDGKPQPYHTEQDKTDRYMHIFHPKTEEEYTEHIFFVPVTGKKGDTLEFACKAILNPDYSRKETGYNYPFQLSSGPYSYDDLITFRADPPEAVLPEIKERLISCEVSFEDAYEPGWTEEDWNTEVERDFKVDASHLKDQKIIKATISVWGCPNLHYGFIVYVDNLPVAHLPESLIFEDIRPGQKTVVTCTIDMSDFDGESTVYGILASTNYHSIPDSHGFLYGTKYAIVADQDGTIETWHS